MVLIGPLVILGSVFGDGLGIGHQWIGVVSQSESVVVVSALFSHADIPRIWECLDVRLIRLLKSELMIILMNRVILQTQSRDFIAMGLQHHGLPI